MVHWIDRFRWISCTLLALCLIGTAANVSAQDEKEEAPLYGRIVSDDGKPVADAAISLQGSGFYQTKTDDDGRYSFPDAEKGGTYRLQIISKTHVGFTDYRKMPTVDINPNASTKKDFTLPRACRAKITVVNEDGEAIPARLIYRSVAAERFSNSSRASTNRVGVANIGGLKPSSSQYIICATAKGHAPSHITIVLDDPDKVAEEKIVLKVGKTVRGVVLCSDGHPPAGWHIYSLPSWYKIGSHPRGVEIGKDGSFEITNVGDDPQNLSVSISLGGSMSTSRIVLADANLTQMKQPIKATLDYPSPQSMNYLTCKIRWIGQPSKQNFSISGYQFDSRHHVSHHVKASEKTVKVGPMPKGIYRIRPEGSDFEVMNLRGIKNLDDLDSVKVPQDEPLQIVLRLRGKPHVQGKVFDAETKKPIANFQFRPSKVRTLSGPNYVTPDDWKFSDNPEGTFESEVSGPGIYYVTVLADGYGVSDSKQVNTDESPDDVLEIGLIRGVRFKGKITDTDGNKVQNASVRMLSMARGSMTDRFTTRTGEVKTNVDGEFVIPNAREGHDTIRVEHPDFVGKRLSVNVSADAKPTKVTLTKGATIEGVVYDSKGKPLANQMLYFQDDLTYGSSGNERAGRLATATTDAKGFYRADHIASRTVYVRRSDPWQVEGVVRHVVNAKDGQTHTLNFGGESRVTGKYKINGQPVANKRLQITRNDSTFGPMVAYGRTSDDGTFVFYGIPPGQWTLYRAIDGIRGEWTKVRAVIVPADGEVDLGLISHKMGTIKVNFTTDTDALPENLRLRLEQRNDQHMSGRPAALLVPRTDPNDPAVFQQVCPGDYELSVSGKRLSMQIRKPVKITDETVNEPINIHFPRAKASLRAVLRNRENKPLGSSVTLWSEDKSQFATMKTLKNDAGEPYHELNDLADGKYTITGYLGRSTIGTVEIRDGKDVAVDIKIPDFKRQLYQSVSVFDEEGIFMPCKVEVIGDDLEGVTQFPRRLNTSFMVPADSKLEIELSHPGYETQRMKMPKSAVIQKITLKRSGLIRP